MRYVEFATHLDESITQPGNPEKSMDKPNVIAALTQAGYEIKESGNKVIILAEVESNERSGVMEEALQFLQQQFPNGGVRYSPSRSHSSIGGIVFEGSPVVVLVKQKSIQGPGSRGKLNEENLRSMLQILIMEHGSINVTFVDKRGLKLSINNCNQVDDASLNVADRQKADLILSSSDGKSLPISLKQVKADMWESADTSFGQRAREILKYLQKQKIIKLEQIQDEKQPYFRLSKEIVIEPTPEEAMGAIFGSDLFQQGGVVVQTFQDEHFATTGNNVTIQSEYIFTRKEDIPTSHLMVWIIRNAKARNNPLPGLRTMGVTLTRGIGTKGTKDVILVDANGNVVQNPNKK